MAPSLSNGDGDVLCMSVTLAWLLDGNGEAGVVCHIHTIPPSLLPSDGPASGV